MQSQREKEDTRHVSERYNEIKRMRANSTESTEKERKNVNSQRDKERE